MKTECFNTGCDYHDTAWEHNCREIGLVSFKKCNKFKGEPEPQGNGMNIYQPDSEFETVTISLHTKEAARDFFTIQQKIGLHLTDPIERVVLTESQSKILVKLCSFGARRL